MKNKKIKLAVSTAIYILSSVAFGQSEMAKDKMGKAPIKKSTYELTANLEHEEGDFSKSGGRLSLGHMSEEKYKFLLGASLYKNSFDRPSILSTEGKSLEIKEFDTASIKFALEKAFSPVNRFAFSLEVTSINQKAFEESDDNTYGMRVSYTSPSSGRNLWVYGVNFNYSKNNSQNIPYPFLTYSYNPSAKFQALFGVPFKLTYRPVPKLKFSTMYIPVKNLKAEIEYQVLPALKVEAGYKLENLTSYRPVERENLEESVYFLEKQYYLSMKSDIYQGITFEVKGAYFYNRNLWIGEKSSEKNSTLVSFENETRVLSNLLIAI